MPNDDAEELKRRGAIASGRSPDQTKLTLDFASGDLELVCDSRSQTVPIYSAEAFRVISDAWLKIGWVVKYIYGFTWMGRPIIQLPDDLIRMQEVIFRVKPDVIIETGIAHGGSLIFYASLCKTMDVGRVIGIDVEIRPHNRKAIDEHPLRPLITLIEGSSIAAAVVSNVKELVRPGEKVLVILDSNHSKEHVLAELEAYASLVSVGSYIVATDGIMEALYDAPRGKPEWRHDNPAAAADEFVLSHPGFVCEEPVFSFNEGSITTRITHWPRAFLKRVSASDTRPFAR